MKKIYFLLFCVISNVGFAQWTENILYDGNESFQKLLVADVDSDGLIDVISMTQGGGFVSWYKNLGGSFDEPRFVGALFEGVGIAVGDIDNDGYVDVVGQILPISTNNRNLFYYRNIDGTGAFEPPKSLLTPNTGNGRSVLLADLDGDNKFDIIAGTSSNQKLTWYKNLGGNGNFDEGNEIVSNYVNGSAIDVGDIDGDGDIDIVAGTGNLYTSAWFENLDGQGTFSPPQQIGLPQSAVNDIHLEDVDGDNDLDVICSRYDEGGLYWLENLDGQGNFGQVKPIEETLFISNIHAADLDNDNDLDLLALAPGFLRWYENLDGQGNFSSAKIIKDTLPFAIAITAADLDSDGDMDPITASQSLFKIYWFENNLLGIQENQFGNSTIYPNPVSDILKIKSSEKLTNVKFYDVFGRKIALQTQNLNEIDVSKLPSGIYLITIKTENGSFTQKLIKE